MATTPTVNFPTNTGGFSTNLENITIKGSADASTDHILVNGVDSTEISYVSGATEWSFTTMLSAGENNYEFRAVDGGNITSPPSPITVTYIDEDNLNLSISPPTGITLERGKNTVSISVIENHESEVIGYNFYASESVGGGTTGYKLLNNTLIASSSFFKENDLVLSSEVSTSGDIRTSYTVEKVTRDYYYTYSHDRTSQPLGVVPLSEPNHYVVTAVAFDRDLLVQTESSYSAELGAAPLIIDVSLRDLPSRSTLDVQQSYIGSVLDADDSIDVKPGTVTRDIHINPPSDEFARLYVIQNFIHTSQSFLTLLAFDDANGDGESDSVNSSQDKLRLKEALLITDENIDQVQDLIDDSFTKLAGNVNTSRQTSRKSIGQALFYTRKTPTKDVVINAGGVIETISDENTSPVQFTILADFIMKVADLESYYNPTMGRYETTLDIQALVSGGEGNIDANKIRLVVSGVDSVFGVDNPNETEFGQDIESNASLAQRSLLAFVSVDSGTEAGYLATTLGTPNTQRTRIISAGETLMQRDLDPLRLVHTFGMVDIYLQGSSQATVTENFGFTYATKKGTSCLIQSVDFFHFKVVDEDLNISKPVFQVLEVKNVTKSTNYDTSGYEIIGDGDVIDLDETLPSNEAIGLDPTDTIVVSYRYRDSDPYIFKNQPVVDIVSVVGDQSGSLTIKNYILEKLQDPLSFGNSTLATDQMQMNYANGVPNGSIKTVTDESHSLIAENTTELNRYGVDSDTISITDTTNTTTYQKDVDYLVIDGSQDTKTQIKRTPTSSIVSGRPFFVDYEAGENFQVTYNVNSLLTDVQGRVNTMKHLTADVLVKGAIRTFIDFDMKVLLKDGTDQTSIDRKIRTNVSRVLSDKLIGESVYQSDVIHAVERVEGVSHVEVPFSKMVKATGSVVIREPYLGSWEPFQTVNVTTYRSNVALGWSTSEGGGGNSRFRGVFENDIELLLVDEVSKVSEGAGRAHISGDGYLYASPKLNAHISDSKVTTTYLVVDGEGARDVSFCDIEYGAVGTLLITYGYIQSFKGF